VKESITQIVIIFPAAYDKNLGYSVECEVLAGLLGDTSCTVSKSKVYISGFDTYKPSTTQDKNPIKVNLLGVINPNAGQTIDMFTIATYQPSNGYYIDGTSFAGISGTLRAPKWASLLNVSSENVNARLKSNYYINFTSDNYIPKETSKGAVYFDLPP
jgi:hypothetical protein